MVFTTQVFVFYFLPLFLLVYYSLPYGWRNVWITLASYVFYGWWQPWFVGLMLFTTIMDFMWGKVITRPGTLTMGSADALETLRTGKMTKATEKRLTVSCAT